VELVKELVQLRTEIKAMEAILLGQTHARDGTGSSRTDLDVLPSFGGSCGFQKIQQSPEVFRRVGQRLAMVRERQGHQSAPGDAAADTTENEAVSEVGPWRRGCVHHRLVPIGAPKRFEPSRRVEHGSPRMPFHHLGPARIPKRIDSINRRHRWANFTTACAKGTSRLFSDTATLEA
jgi:hypothetical protein